MKVQILVLDQTGELVSKQDPSICQESVKDVFISLNRSVDWVCIVLSVRFLGSNVASVAFPELGSTVQVAKFKHLWVSIN